MKKLHQLSFLALIAAVLATVLFGSCKKDSGVSGGVNSKAVVATWTMNKGVLFYDNSQYARPNEYDTVYFTAPHQDSLIFTQDGHVIDITYVISYVGQTAAQNRYTRFSDTITYAFKNDSTLKFNGFAPTISYVDTAPSVTVLQLSTNMILRNSIDTASASTQTLFFSK